MINVKIMGGILKGFSIPFSKEKLRPTSSLLKRRFFDAYQDFHDDIFIDICAGSGNIGVEAWSRGALKVFLIEKDKQNFKKLENCLKRIQEVKKDILNERKISLFLEDGMFVFKKILKFLTKKEIENLPGKLVFFFDPPYEDHRFYFDFINEFLNFMSEHSSVKILLVIESCSDKGISLQDIEDRISRESKLYTQGTKYLALFNFN